MNNHFEWDEHKRRGNLDKHGVDFPQATELFDGRPTLTVPVVHESEERYLSIGEINQRVMTVVWLQRGGVIRLISARLASRKERKIFSNPKIE